MSGNADIRDSGPVPPGLPVALPGLFWIERELCEAALLSFDEQHGVRPISEKDFRQSFRSCVRIAVRLLLAASFDGRDAAKRAFAVGSYGKPVPVGCRSTFSVTHTADRALVAMAPEGALGVDLEAPRAIPMQVGRRSSICEAAGSAGFVPSNMARDAVANDVVFLAVWTRLEAIGKMRGVGIGTVLGELGVGGRRDCLGSEMTGRPDGAFNGVAHLHEVVVPAPYIASLAWASPNIPPVPVPLCGMMDALMCNWTNEAC